jgi:surface protein
MAYVAKDDIIIQVNSEKDITSGNSQSYEILVFKDFIGNPLDLNEPTSFHVALFVDGTKVIQYSNPMAYGVSDMLNIDEAGDSGKIDFIIDSTQSEYLPSGNIYSEVSIIFENYYPQPKTYIFPRIKLGESTNVTDPGNGGNGGNTGTGPVIESLSDSNIKQAVDLWRSDPTAIEFTDPNNSPYYGHISEWDVSGVEDMSGLFFNFTSFTVDISEWDVSGVTNMQSMFLGADSFVGDISEWDVSNVTSMDSMFNGASQFNRDISSWNVGSVVDMDSMFNGADSFNQNISQWSVVKIPNRPSNFATGFIGGNSINEPEWGILNLDGNPQADDVEISDIVDPKDLVTKEYVEYRVITDSNFQSILQTSLSIDAVNGGDDPVHGPISTWDVSRVTDMSNAFEDAQSFDGNISSWNVSNVYNMHGMFKNSAFSGNNISNWDVSNVTDMSDMFNGNHFFNSDIGNWDVSSVVNMDRMFRDTQTFNKDISSWCVGLIASEPTDFNILSVGISTSNKPIWGSCPVKGKLNAPDVEISDITDPKDLVTLEYIEENTGGSGYSHTGAFADKPLSNNRVWEAGAGLKYTQSDVDGEIWKVFSLNEAVHIEVDNPYWSDPAPDTITNGVFTNTNTGKGLFQGKHLPDEVSSLIEYNYSYDAQNRIVLNALKSTSISDWDTTGVVNITSLGAGTGDISTGHPYQVDLNSPSELSQSALVDPGIEYTVSFTAKKVAGSSFNPHYSIIDATNGNAVIEGPFDYTSLINESGFEQISFQFTAPPGCSEVIFKMVHTKINGGSVILDTPQINEGNTVTTFTNTSNGGAYGKKIIHGYYEYPNQITGYENTTGRIKLNDIKIGDQLRVRFDFNVIPQIANTTVEPALWYSNRDSNDVITYSFPLTTQPIFYGTGTVGKTFLNRPEISAWITSEEDINALALPAIKSDNSVIIQPLGLLITIIR